MKNLPARLRFPFVLFSFLIFHFSFFIFFASPAWADCHIEGTATIGCLGEYIQNTVKFIFPLAAAVALFFLIFGGIKFITSGGDPKAVEGAKKTITYALLGLGVLLSIYAIFWLIKQLTGLDLTVFNIVMP